MKKKFKFMLTSVMTLIMSLGMGVVAYAGQQTTDLDPIVQSLQTSFSVGEIASIIGIIISSGVGFVLLWWGARKLVRAIIGAFKTGKLRF